MLFVFTIIMGIRFILFHLVLYARVEVLLSVQKTDGGLYLAIF